MTTVRTALRSRRGALVAVALGVAFLLGVAAWAVAAPRLEAEGAGERQVLGGITVSADEEIVDTDEVAGTNMTGVHVTNRGRTRIELSGPRVVEVDDGLDVSVELRPASSERAVESVVLGPGEHAQIWFGLSQRQCGWGGTTVERAVRGVEVDVTSWAGTTTRTLDVELASWFAVEPPGELPVCEG
ncbi:DUF4232 domain-containing protein [Actinotalea sp. BY-33]|uniref:DUF4232 domain-containing protein n=1 Tax=Actinotalea soli TaxID=2819234 RepID=A0A939RTN6_9CELL|nr:DUF4232 domain-containing protein [Actinotalea soli]MBO1751494.1 DUF4232 domain-containing protein [Actinotalea soli]